MAYQVLYCDEENIRCRNFISSFFALVMVHNWVEEKLAIQFNTVIIVAKILVHRHTVVKMNIKYLRLSWNSIKDKVFNKYSSRKILPAFLKT